MDVVGPELDWLFDWKNLLDPVGFFFFFLIFSNQVTQFENDKVFKMLVFINDGHVKKGCWAMHDEFQWTASKESMITSRNLKNNSSVVKP